MQHLHMSQVHNLCDTLNNPEKHSPSSPPLAMPLLLSPKLSYVGPTGEQVSKNFVCRTKYVA